MKSFSVQRRPVGEFAILAAGMDSFCQEMMPDPYFRGPAANGDLIFANEDWRDTQEADIVATSIPPTDDRESAIVATLQPAAYTAIVRGRDDTTGIALVDL